MHMQSTATDVDAYLDEVPVERQAVLAAIRQLCLDLLPGYEEGMSYGMPSYTSAEFVGANVGKGCIRYTKPEKVDLAAVGRLRKATAASRERVC
jgi:hypothetical protein